MDVSAPATALELSGGPLATTAGRVGLRGRLLGAILVVSLTTLTVGAVGISRMGELSDQADQVYSDGAVPLDGLRQLQVDWWVLSAHTARANIPSLPPATIANEQRAAAAAAKELTADQATVAGMPLASAATDAFGRFSKSVTAYLTALQQLQANPPVAQVPGLLSTMDSNEATIEESIATATDEATTAAEVTVKEARNAYSSARTTTLLIIGLGLIIAVVLSSAIVRSVMRPVQRVKQVLDRVAGGDLSVRAGDTGGAEIGEVARSLDATLDSLSAVLSLVSDSSGRLAAASQALNPRRRRHGGERSHGDRTGRPGRRLGG